MTAVAEKPKSFYRGKRVRELEEQVAQLEAALGVEPTTLEIWEASLTQEMRDDFAARALIQSWGNVDGALRRLGFKFKKQSGQKAAFMLAAQRVFHTSGVRAIMERDLSKVAENWDLILRRVAQVAMTGEDAASVRATEVLAKITGAQKTPDVYNDNRKLVVTLQQLVNPQDALVASKEEEVPAGRVGAMEFLAHEPGDPTRVTVGDDVIDAAIVDAEEIEADDGMYDGSV